MRFIVTAALLSIAFAWNAALPALADQWPFERIVDQSVPAGTASSLVVQGENGDVRLVAAATNVVAIHARVRVRDQSALTTIVHAQRMGNRVEIDAKCPSGGRLFGYTNACDVETTVTYPRNMSLEVQWVNGNITAENPNRDVTAHLTNGDVTVKAAAGSLVLSTRHGDIDTSLANGWHGTTLDLSVSQGDVVARVPRGFNGYLAASVRLGDVENRAHLPTSAPNASSTAIRARTIMGDVTVTF